ncbi:Hypothetical predicted protein, partial [Pelobates cultripes]
MDEFLSTPQDTRSAWFLDKMVPASPGAERIASSAQGSHRGETLRQISSALAAISANMLSRTDKAEMLAEIRTAIREEVMEVRRDLTDLERK